MNRLLDDETEGNLEKAIIQAEVRGIEFVVKSAVKVGLVCYLIYNCALNIPSQNKSEHSNI